MALHMPKNLSWKRLLEDQAKDYCPTCKQKCRGTEVKRDNCIMKILKVGVGYTEVQ